MNAKIDGAAVVVTISHVEMSIFGELTHSNVRGSANFYFDRYGNLIDHRGPAIALIGKLAAEARRYATRKNLFAQLRRMEVADFSA